MKTEHHCASVRLILMCAAVALCVAPVSYGELERVGPIMPENGYPAWYQDTTGLTLEFGAPLNQAELDGGWCLLLPADVPSGTAPETFPTDFAEEHFYWSCEADVEVTENGQDVRLRLVMALEATFGLEAIAPGDQVVFGRMRIRIIDCPYDGTYNVYTPYGNWEFNNQEAGEKLTFTADIGIGAPGTFDGALTSHIGPFLLPSNTPGGAELPPVTGPVPGKLYIADPDREGPVTGSPIGQNFFRVEGPNNFVVEVTDFSLTGRIYTETIPTKVIVNRATYTRNETAQYVDVFAQAFPTTLGRLPGSATPEVTTPVLSFYPAPPTVDDETEELSAPTGVEEVPMFGSGTTYWGQVALTSIPTSLTVKENTSRDGTGQLVPTFFEVPVTDGVTVLEAIYDPASDGSLFVSAVSNDEIVEQTLTLSGFGELVDGQTVVSPLAVPPSKVRVVSSAGGAGDMLVAVLPGAVGSGDAPIASNDTATLTEDTTANFNVLANDTVGGEPIVFGPNVSVAITSAPHLGNAVVNADGTIGYTPSLNAAGTDSIGYTVSVDGTSSRVSTLTITITPVNDRPIANNDTVSAVVGSKLIDVLGNDTDPDGFADLATAVIVTQPQAGATARGGSVVTFTATAPGTYTFTYRARDLAGLTSVNPATVTVTVSAVETITVRQSMFRTKASRWIVSGTNSVLSGQTMTITYANGVLANGSSAVGTVVGTAQVSPTGTWALNLRGVTGVLNPTDRAAFLTLPTQLRITSSLGSSQTATITVRN